MYLYLPIDALIYYDILNMREIKFSGVGYRYGQEEVDVVTKAMLTGSTLTQGEHQLEFEAKFNKLMGDGDSFAFSNAASALEMVAHILNISQDEEIIAPSHTYTASVYPFAAHGAKIVWADIDPYELVVTAETISKLITEKTRAIIVVDLYGLPVDIAPIYELCQQRDIVLIHDCAQSLGAKDVDGLPTGKYADFAIYSFQSHKNISTLGEGGMLWIKDREIAGRIPGLRHNGHRPFESNRPYYWYPAMVDVDLDDHGLHPRNYCLGEVQCALGVYLLDKVDQLASLRSERFRVARDMINSDFYTPQLWADNRISSHHLMPLRLRQSDSNETTNKLMSRLVSEFGVFVAKQYRPLHDYSYYKKLGLGSARVPETDKFYMQQVSIPFHSWMTDNDFSYMIESLNKAVKD